MLKPVNNNIIVQEVAQETSSNFKTPTSDAVEQVEYGEVKFSDNESFTVGTKLWFSTHSTLELKHAGEEYFVLQDQDVVAIDERRKH